ncbi:sigma-54 interaction domain-containing protein [Thermohalobacter berrensis]|uniref:HTH-type transcriptional regulatory protein TyrR n=1 Tax=Thermohalobacter berrensis TaxID=99594 RepID=A0A419T539_9FIRM|nr:sigma 54-interacting transcriptional regulator [Thermohalobacter berrensis]RKD32553.1 hypothetical protein BET03_10785 [Thermohalobacter berrensis]
MKIIKIKNGKKVYSEDDYYLFEHSEDGICIINEAGFIEYMNTSFTNKFRFDKKIELGANIFKTKIDDLIKKSLTRKKCIKGTLVYSNSHGCVEVTTWPIFLENKFKGIIVLFRNSKNKLIDSRETNESEETIKLERYFTKIVGKSERIKKVLLMAQKASKSISTVLIRGKSGTGKELISKAIHYNSSRSKGPFVKINCGAIPANLIESELFGYEEGAFTGAVRRKIGKFEQANGGTIFLDEIGDLPLNMQVKLLRVLQEKEFERVGGIETIKTDVRIIAATNRNLEEMVENGQFREDLYYRLNVIPIYLPSLQERREDIPLLIDHFIKKISKKLNKEPIKLSEEAIKCLYYYDWPGNVRELENIIERLIVLSEKDVVEVTDLPTQITNIYEIVCEKEKGYTGLVNFKSNGELAKFEEYEKEIIKLALKKYKSFNAAGKALGITHRTVANKARKYNIVD